MSREFDKSTKLVFAKPENSGRFTCPGRKFHPGHFGSVDSSGGGELWPSLVWHLLKLSVLGQVCLLRPPNDFEVIPSQHCSVTIVYRTNYGAWTETDDEDWRQDQSNRLFQQGGLSKIPQIFSPRMTV